MPPATHDQRLLDIFPEPMLMTAKDGLIHFSNQAAIELLQRSSADLDGRDICGLVTEPREKVEQYLLRCSRGAQFHIGLLTFKTSRGDEIPCRCDGARLELAGKTEALLIRQTPRTESATPFAALDDRIQALNRSRHELENQVRVRTAGLVRAQGALRELSATLMQAQDEGRRRLAHELQDSTGQILTGIQMHLGVILSDPGLALEFRGRLTQTIDLTHQAMTKIRTLSNLLHPPLLDEAGLPLALRSFAERFETQTGIAVTVEISSEFMRVASEIETAIFRIVQECLLNVHRHSQSDHATVRMALLGNQLELEVRDRGRGIPPDRLGNAPVRRPGVGLRGMRERVRLMGGSMEFLDANPGAIVKVVLPV